MMMTGSKRRSSSYPLHLLILMMTCSIIGLASGNDYSITSVVVSRSVGSGPVNASASSTFAFTCVVNYTCTGTCNQTQSLNIRWTLNGEAINTSLFNSDGNTTKNDISGSGTSNDILTSMGNVRVSHAGMYSCTATLGQRSSSGNTETLTVVVPSPTVTVTNDTANVGDSATLNCTGTFVDNLITPVYSWSPVTGSNSMLGLTASLDNAGQHNCNVTGSYTRSNSAYVMLPASVITPAYLTVNVPSPMVSITNSTANIGDTTSLTCQVSDFPVGIDPVYSWSPVTGSNSMLELIASLDNAGQHNCNVTGSYSGSNSAHVTLPASVITPAYLTVNVIVSATVTGTATVTAGDTHLLNCSTNATNGLNVSYEWSGPLTTSNQSITLNPVTTANAGTYTCTATVSHSNEYINIQPMMPSDTATLSVKIPTSNVSLSSVSAAIGGPANFTCNVNVSDFVSESNLTGLSVVSHSINPTINNVMEPVRTGRIFTLTYNIDTVAAGNGGVYNCTASVSHSNDNILTSDAGSGTGTLYVSSVAVTPAAITRLDVSPYNNFSLTCAVTTTPSPPSSDTTYSWANGSNTIDGANSSTLTRNGITAGNFTFTCTAGVNVTGATGTAMPTDSANVIIKGSAPPVQPELVSIDTNPFDATIKWRVSQVAYTPEDYVINYSVDNVTINSTGVVASTVVNSNLDFITRTNLEYDYIITGLMSGMRYSFEIISNNTVGSNSSTNNTFYTDDSPPFPPSNVALSVISSSSLQLSWDPPTIFTGDITDYHYVCIGLNDTSGYTRVDDGSSNFINGEQRVVMLTDLEPFREYFCNVTAATSAGPGSPANITAVTGQAAPTGPPLDFTITSTDPSNLMLSWRPPNPPEANGIINIYYYYCTGGGSSSSLINGNATTNDSITITFNGIRPFTNYTCFINSGTIVGTGPYANTTGRTAEAAPSMVQDLSVSRASDTSFSIRWSVPAAPNGIITDYTVLVLHYTSRTTAGTGRVDDVRNTVVTVSGLSPYIPYNITVYATTRGGDGPNASTINFTKEGSPAAVTNIDIDRLSDTSVNVSWTPLTLVEARGFITNYTVSLTSVNNDRRRQSGPTMTVPASQSYAVFTGLAADVSYTVLVSATTAAGNNVTSGPTVPSAVAPTTPKSTSSPVGAILGAVFAVLAIVIIIIIVIIVLYYLRTRRIKGELTIEENTVALQEMKKGSSTDLNGKEQEEPAALTAVTTEVDKERWAPIPVAQFAAHTAKLHSDRDLGFEDEYKSLKNIPQGSYTCSKLPENVSKNRFDNVFPYDASRVELTEVADKRGSDYINASFIDGYKRPKAYIAAQGPLSNTVGDFWRMVWEFQLPTIVMLTELIERGIDKCSCYWPRALNETLDVGYDLQVTLVEQQQYVDYKLKKFLLLNTSSTGGRLDVTHYHFLAWPDHGVPADKTIMLAFIRRVRQTHPSEGPPLIVHCSAGVGRTGTFITLDSMQQRLDKDEQDLNIYEFLANMRTKRVLMVQTEAQYVYIHDALSEYITCGDTSMTTKRLKIVMDELAKVSEHKSGYEKQLDLINQVCRQPSEGLLCDALSKTNSNKNRFLDKLDTLPYDMTRVRLKTASGTGDYINANHVDGYKHRGAFLATQAPMGDTVEDFWRMVWEQWSSSIVMLCNLEEKDKEVCARYWPEKVDETITYGKMVVKLISEEKRPHYMIRKIMLSQENTYINVSAGAADHLVVTQFHYGDWPEDDKPKNETPLLKLIDQLLHNQMNTGNKAITIMCSDGVGRTGCFMCMYSVLERIKIEGVADIFQYIKGARFNRPGLVQNVVQYEFCHDLVLEYINSFDAYHNF